MRFYDAFKTGSWINSISRINFYSDAFTVKHTWNDFIILHIQKTESIFVLSRLRPIFFVHEFSNTQTLTRSYLKIRYTEKSMQWRAVHRCGRRDACPKYPLKNHLYLFKKKKNRSIEKRMQMASGRCDACRKIIYTYLKKKIIVLWCDYTKWLHGTERLKILEKS